MGEYAGIIGAAILVIIVGCIIGVRWFKLKKADPTLTSDDFIKLYLDNVINALKDVVVIISERQEDFDSKEEYYKAIISETVNKIKENADELEIDMSIINLFSTEALTDCVYKILVEHRLDIFAVLPAVAITNHEALYDEDVVSTFAIKTSEETE